MRLVLRNHLNDFVIIDPVDQIELVLKMIIKRLTVQTAVLDNIRHGDLIETFFSDQLFYGRSDRFFCNQRIRHTEMDLANHTVLPEKEDKFCKVVSAGKNADRRKNDWKSVLFCEKQY